MVRVTINANTIATRVNIIDSPIILSTSCGRSQPSILLILISLMRLGTRAIKKLK